MLTPTRITIAALVFMLASCGHSDRPPGAHEIKNYALAAELYSQGRLNEALGLLMKNEESSPGFRANTLLCGRVLFYSGDFSGAGECLARALEDEMNIAGAALLIRIRIREGRTAEALTAADRALGVSPEDPELLYLKALCLLKQGNTAEALGLLKTAEALLTRRVEIPLELAELCTRYGLYDDACTILERYRGMALGTPLEAAVDGLTEQIKKRPVSNGNRPDE